MAIHMFNSWLFMETIVNSWIFMETIVNLYKEHTRIYPDDGTPHTHHVTTNAIVKVGSNGFDAECKSYAIVFQSTDDFPIQPIIGVQYFDKFEKAYDGWRFSERKIVSRLFGDSEFI